MASNDQKDSDNQCGCSSGEKKNGDHNRKRKVGPKLENTSTRSSTDRATSLELTQHPVVRRTESGDNHDKGKLLLALTDKDKNLYPLPRHVMLLVDTALRERQKEKQQQEKFKLTALKIASFRHYTPEEEKEERWRGLSTRLELYSDPWNIKKRLTPSDVGGLSRIQVQTNQVETHLKPYMVRAGVFKQVLSKGLEVSVWDVDTDTVHELVLKQWKTSKSYVFNGNWNQEFVHRRNLKEDDKVGFLCDPHTFRFFFKVLSRAPPNPNP